MDNNDPPHNDSSRPVSPVSTSSQNIFGDEFAEDYAPSIVAPSVSHEHDEEDDSGESTQYNPFDDPPSTHIDTQFDSQETLSHPLQPTPQSSTPTLSPDSQERQQQPQQPQYNSRFSIRKNPSGPLHDYSSNVYSSSSQLPRRTDSASSLVAPQSPVDAENGPSHPYSMYPQGIGVSRTTSLVTSSDIHAPSLRSSPRPQQPAFPYAMYPQDISGSDSSTASDPSFNVGFPGHGQSFHRRIGADGEEQDIIGLDGHTEQLPPYTRYPFPAAITKGPNDFGSSLPVIGEANQSRDNLVEIRRPASDSISTSSASNIHTYGPSSSTEPLINTSGHQVMSEKEIPFKDKTWREKRKHRIWGCLPVWMLLLAIAVIIIIVTVCAGVIAGYATQLQDQYQKAYHSPSASTAPAAQNTLIDASLITTPTSVTLPTGIFEVPLSAPDTRFPACLKRKQAGAWSCDLPPSQYIPFKIYGTPDKLWLDTIVQGVNVSNATYGTQPPELKGERLKLVIDIDDRSLGAAYHFQTFYDKLVIIPEYLISGQSVNGLQESLIAALSSRSFNLDNLPENYPPVEPGDFAWFCSWDDTFIEGFIYITEIYTTHQSTSTGTSSPTSGTYTTPTTAYPPPPTTPPSGSDPRSYQPLGSTDTTYPYSTSTMPIMPPPTTPAPTSNSYVHQVGVDIVDEGLGALQPRYDSETPSPYSSIPSSTLPSYPLMTHVVKLEERRLNGFSRTPLCTKMIFQYNFQWAIAYNSQQQAVTIQLEEDDGGNWMSKYRYRAVRRDVGPEPLNPNRGIYRTNKGYHGDLQDTCYCQWISFVPPPAHNP